MNWQILYPSQERGIKDREGVRGLPRQAPNAFNFEVSPSVFDGSFCIALIVPIISPFTMLAFLYAHVPAEW